MRRQGLKEFFIGVFFDVLRWRPDLERENAITQRACEQSLIIRSGELHLRLFLHELVNAIRDSADCHFL